MHARCRSRKSQPIPPYLVRKRRRGAHAALGRWRAPYGQMERAISASGLGSVSSTPGKCKPRAVAVASTRLMGGSLKARATRNEQELMEHISRRAMLQQSPSSSSGGIAPEQQRLGQSRSSRTPTVDCPQQTVVSSSAQLFAQLVVQIHPRGSSQQHEAGPLLVRPGQRHALLLPLKVRPASGPGTSRCAGVRPVRCNTRLHVFFAAQLAATQSLSRHAE